MEGDQLTFFIFYEGREVVLELSEYDTVEQLKIEIDNKFDIAVARQKITGWHSPPISDDTILKMCCQTGVINCLYVNAIDSTSNAFEEFLPNQEMDFVSSDSVSEEVVNFGSDSMEDYLGLELDAIAKLKEKLPVGLPLTVKYMSLQDAVSHISSPSSSKKALLLYLHNSNDTFSQNFIRSIFSDELNMILESTFFVIGWDIEDYFHHKALIQALIPHQHLSFLSHLIADKTGAAVCLMANGDRLELFSCLKGNVSYDSILEHLLQVREQCVMDDSTENASSLLEIDSIKSLRGKLPSNISITLRHVSLEDAIKFICTAPFSERKALFLYLHNSAYPFSQMFSQNLADSELARILNKKFLILGWDVEDSTYHNALVSALSQHINLAIVSDLVTNKVAVGLCILPVAGTISVFLCLRDKVTLKEAVKSLKEAEKAFDKEIEKEIELEQLEREKSSQNDLGSEKLHAIWADMLGDRDYDSFEYNQHELLKKKIGFALNGPPKKETGYDEKELEHIDAMFGVIKRESNQIAQYRDHIEVSFIYNCLEPLPADKIKRSKRYPDYNPQTDVNPVPIFVLRRCRGSDNPCRIFIDNTQRVYDSWNGYLTKNKFAECEMVVPINGRYQVVDNTVQLQRLLSPACHLDAKLLFVGDIISTAAGLASGAVFLTAAASFAAIPVAPGVLIAAGVAGAGAGIWAIGRSAYALYDRNKHKESMSFANSEARGAYLNIVAGSLGFAGAGANMALTQLVTRGVNIGQGATYFVNTIGVLNLGAGGASLVNSGYEVFDQWYNENQKPSALTIIQLSSSVLFFGHAVYNFKGAQTIVDETQARVLKDYQDSLRSNRHRKTFNKMMKETMRTQGSNSKGRAEVISAIRNIPNKDEVFAALTRNNKAMNKAGVRFSADGGQITLGGIPVDMNEFIGLNKKQTETFLSDLTQNKSSQIPSTNNYTSNDNGPLNAAINKMLSNIGIDGSTVNTSQVIALTMKLLMFCSGDIKVQVVNAVDQAIQYIFHHISKNIADVIDQIIPKNMQFIEFLRLGISFFSQKVDEWEQNYQQYQKTGDKQDYHPMFDKVNPLYVRRTVEIFEFVVRNSYSGMRLTTAILSEISRFIVGWVTRIIFEKEERKESDRMRECHSAGFEPKQVSCHVCGGYYFQHES